MRPVVSAPACSTELDCVCEGVEDVTPQRRGAGPDSVYEGYESWPTCSGGSYGDTRADEREGYESLIERTNTWLRDESDVSVVNIQSILVQKDNTAGESDSVPVTLLAGGRQGRSEGAQNGVHPLRSSVTSVLF